MKDSSLFRVPIVASLLLLGVHSLSHASPIVGETHIVQPSNFFSLGNASWITTGPVASATLRDNEFTPDAPIDSSIWSVASISGSQHFLQFDLQSDISSSNGQFSIPDFFQASLFFTNDIGSFDVDDPSTYSVADLLLIDSNGPELLDPNGTMAVEADHVRFMHMFESNFAYVIPYFVLFDMDFTPTNSSIDIRGLSLRATTIPVSEPGTGLLLAMGLVASFILRSRKS